MLSSIQAALPMARGEAFFIAHADMPFVAAEAYRALGAGRARRLSAGLPEAAMIASHEGRPGHPVLIPSDWIPGIPRPGSQRGAQALPRGKGAGPGGGRAGSPARHRYPRGIRRGHAIMALRADLE